MQYWLTNPNLTPAHDWKCDAGALVDHVRSGWRIREDQSDPVDSFEPADPRPPVEEPDPVDPKTPAAVVAPETKTTTTKKGS